MKSLMLHLLLPIAIVASLLALSPAARAQNSTADLDGDGIPNIADRDVDNDGILNGADRNIDGGTARSGPFRGRYIGDKLPNDSPQELDMDADGLDDDAAAETDIDGDGLLNGERRETDIDGDGLLDNSTAETDIDGDGLADDAAAETDIDGDRMVDGSREEVDTDGDGIPNGLDGNVDGDRLANNSDPDMYGTGFINDIFQLPGSEEAYAPDASVASTIAYVSGQIRQKLKITATDKGLRVRVNPVPFGSLVTGVWRYLSADNIQVSAKWCYSASNPSDLNITAHYIYTGPYSENPADYTNPANYAVSEESRLIAEYPIGAPLNNIPEFTVGTSVSWMPGQPAGFYFRAFNKDVTGFAPPYQPLVNALASLPNFTSDQQDVFFGPQFSGNLGTSPGLSTLQPLLNLQRVIMNVSRAWYGTLEAPLLL